MTIHPCHCGFTLHHYVKTLSVTRAGVHPSRDELILKLDGHWSSIDAIPMSVAEKFMRDIHQVTKLFREPLPMDGVSVTVHAGKFGHLHAHLTPTGLYHPESSVKEECGVGVVGDPDPIKLDFVKMLQRELNK